MSVVTVGVAASDTTAPSPGSSPDWSVVAATCDGTGVELNAPLAITGELAVEGRSRAVASRTAGGAAGGIFGAASATTFRRSATDSGEAPVASAVATAFGGAAGWSADPMATDS